MSEIRIPLPNGTQLIFSQSEHMENSLKTSETEPIIKEDKTTNESQTLDEPKNDQKNNEKENSEKKSGEAENIKKEKIPLMVSSVDELQEISLALIYYKTYLQGKGQKEKALQIGEIDHKVFQTIQQVQKS